MKMRISHLHLDILDNTRQQIFEKLPVHTKNYYLSGGTGLALQLGHRISHDFDFFSPEPVSCTLLEQFSREIRIQSVAIDTGDELTMFTAQNVKITFLHYPFPLVHELIQLENGIQVASIDEIAAQKAYTIGRRGEYRDYFDVHAILTRTPITLSTIIRDSERKYGTLFNSKLFLEQLVYFTDLHDTSIIPVSDERIPKPEQIKTFFEQEVKKYLARM